MRDRFLFQEVWERQGMPVKECMEIALHSQGQQMFRQMLFAKIVRRSRRWTCSRIASARGSPSSASCNSRTGPTPLSDVEQSASGATSARF